MAKKHTKAKEKKPTLENIQRELFCQLYVNDRECFGKAGKSYARAYDKEEAIKKLEEELVVIRYSREDERKQKRQEILKANNVCEVNGTRLLRDAQIKARVSELFDETYTDLGVDKELTWAIKQTKDIASKVAAIREYNRVKNRVEEKVVNNNVIYSWATEKDLHKGAKLPEKKK